MAADRPRRLAAHVQQAIAAGQGRTAQAKGTDFAADGPGTSPVQRSLAESPRREASVGSQPAAHVTAAVNRAMQPKLEGGSDMRPAPHVLAATGAQPAQRAGLQTRRAPHDTVQRANTDRDPEYPEGFDKVDWMCPGGDELRVEQAVWQFGKSGVRIDRLAKFLNMSVPKIQGMLAPPTGQQATSFLAVALMQTRDNQLIHYFHLGLEKRFTGAMGPRQTESNEPYDGGLGDFLSHFN